MARGFFDLSRDLFGIVKKHLKNDRTLCHKMLQSFTLEGGNGRMRHVFLCCKTNVISLEETV